VKVWRLEDTHGHGAFRASYDSYSNYMTFRTWALSTMDVNTMGDAIPLPEDDGINPYATAGWRYGVASPEGLLRWFGRDVTPFVTMGLCVDVYDVPRTAVAVGGHQVAFDPRFARLVEHHEVSAFWAAHVGVAA
jgi:hypothetical protein